MTKITKIRNCDLCLQNVEPKVGNFSRTKCQHVFHRQCLMQWRKIAERQIDSFWSDAQVYKDPASRYTLYCPTCDKTIFRQDALDRQLRVGVFADKVDAVSKALLEGARCPGEGSLVEKDNILSVAMEKAGEKVMERLGLYDPLFALGDTAIREKILKEFREAVKECIGDDGVVLDDFDLGKTRGEIIRRVMEDSPASENWVRIVFCDRDLVEPHFAEICAGLETLTMAKSLRFLRVKMDEDVLWRLVRSINVNPGIESLYFSGNDLGNDGLFVVSTLLEAQAEDGAGVRRLRVCENGIREDGMFALSAALAVNQTLKLLDLDGNDLDAKGASHLAFALQHNKTLTDLSVCQNPLGNDGCIALFNAIAANPKTKIRYMDLDEVQMGDEAMQVLLDLREQHPHVSKIVFSLDDNVLTGELKRKASWLKTETDLEGQVEKLPECFRKWVRRNWSSLSVAQAETRIRMAQLAMAVAETSGSKCYVNWFRMLPEASQNQRLPEIQGVKSKQLRDRVCTLAAQYLEIQEREAGEEEDFEEVAGGSRSETDEEEATTATPAWAPPQSQPGWPRQAAAQ